MTGDPAARLANAGGALTSRRLVRRLFLFSVALLLASTLIQSYLSLRIFETQLGPAIDAKAETIGRTVAREIDRAVALGIPFESLVGMTEYLAAAHADHREIAYVVVTDADGRPLYGAGRVANAAAAVLPRAGPPGYRDVAVPLRDATQAAYGAVHLGIDEGFVLRALRDVAIDILTVLLVTLLITFEVLAVLAALGIVLPIRAVERLMADYESGRFDSRSGMAGGGEVARLGRALDDLGGRVAAAFARLRDEHEVQARHLRDAAAARAAQALHELTTRFRLARPEERRPVRVFDFAHVRGPLVVFILAEELSRSFMPIYIGGLATPVFGLAPEVLASLPIAFYMLLVAVGTPFAGRWVDRIGARRIFLAGTVPTVIGMIGTAFAQGVWDLLLWRGLAAIGYAMSTIAAQGYLSRVADEDKRVQGMGIYVGAVMVAAICGTAIGAILAERVGYQAIFLISAAIAALAAALAHRFLFDPPAKAGAAAVAVQPGLGDIALLLRRPLFAVLMLGVAVPAKVVLTGFLFYLMPLYLSGIGSSQSDIGRAMTVYFVLMAVGTKLVAPLADLVGKRSRFILLGGLVAGAGPLLLLVDQGLLPALIAAAAVGLGQALATAPVMALVTEVAARETPQVGSATVLSVFRVLERIGSVAGPFLAAGLAAAYGYAVAMASMGVVVLAGTAFFAAAFALRRGNSAKAGGIGR